MIRHLHSSSRFDRSPLSLLTLVKAFLGRVDLITLTEVGNNKRVAALKRLPGWSFTQVEGSSPAGGDECAMLTRDAVLKVLSVQAVQLTTKATSDRGTRKTFALTATVQHQPTLRNVVVSVVHLPAHVEKGDALAGRPADVEAWKDSVSNWARRLEAARVKGFDVIAVADWNTDFRRAAHRERVDKLMPALKSVWATVGMPKRGTHGSRVIDDTRTTLQVDGARLVNTFGSSDHVAYLTKLSFPKEAPMVQRRLTGMADALRKAGLKVVEVDGWRARSRPASTGGFDPVGVLCHHTATKKSLSDKAVVDLLVKGRSDLPGPLCNLGLSRDGTVYVISAGRANHAGKAKASGSVAAGDGNALYVGIEAFNDGVGEPWPKVQYDAYVKVCAVLCGQVTGSSARTVRGHKETSVTGKVDPRFDMDKFRADVAAAMKPPAKKPAGPARFELIWTLADRIVRNKNYSAPKRAAAAAIRAAAAPFRGSK